MRAKFPGTCPLSGKTINAGDEILFHGGKWALAEAARAAAPAVAVKAEVVANAKINPSLQQEAVFQFVKSGSGNGAIIAVAGSGKTTTLLMAMQYVPQSASCAFVAFNKHIADELKKRCPAHVRVHTVHSLGLANVRQLWGGDNEDDPIVVDAEKVEALMDAAEELKVPASRMDKANRTRVINLRMAIRRLVSMCKLTLTEPTPQSLLELAWQYGIDMTDNDDLVYHFVPAILSSAAECDRVVDFDDMLWLPIIRNAPLKHFDFLFIDEAQDLNPLQLEFVTRSVRKDGGRVLAVGDPRQSIFGWAGADVEAMPRLVTGLSALEMPLSVTYRCPRSHVELVRELCPDIEARDGAPDGIVRHVSISGFEPAPGDMVICRTNAPLIPHAFACIRSGTKAVVRGRDIGRHLAGLAAKIVDGARTRAEAENKLQVWLRAEVSKLQLKGAPASQLEAVNDRAMTIRAVLAECSLPAEAPSRLEQIFSDNCDGVLFSSVHRAKGLEADRVWILRPESLGARPNAKGWEIEQEENVKYVALTRSKMELVFVHDNRKQEK